MLASSIVALYILLPITTLTFHSLPSGIFYALIVGCCTLLVRERFCGALEQTQKYGLLLISYSVLFLATAASSLYHGTWAGANSEGAIRLFLGLWILLLALIHIDMQRLRHTTWGVYATCLVSTVVLIWLIINVEARPLTPGVILTTYSSIMLLLGAISVYSLKWPLTPSPRMENAVKILAAGVAFVGFLAAQTRTGLLALPIFFLLGIVLFVDIKKPAKVLAWSLVSAALLIATVAYNDALRGRIVDGIHEVQACHGKNSTQYSSMCIRLQLWRTAVDAGTSHPWVGLGSGSEFIRYMEEVAVPKGLAAQVVVDEYFGEPHSDLMSMFAAFGFPGVLGLLLIYLAPCTYFVPRLFNAKASAQARAAAAMGLAVCLGFLLFGLTETMFRRMSTIGFYTAMVALFMVLSEHKPSRQDKPVPPALP